jgi:DNA-binding transcriptional MerR regulator/methylmalonyl-CoA mutase cobalamin-binding subunit
VSLRLRPRRTATPRNHLELSVPYRIKTVADLIGVPRATLLAWERRYSVVSPDRKVNGYRAYSEEDVAVLRSVKALVDRGLKVSEAVARVREQPVVPAPRGGVTLGPLRQEVLAALLEFDRDRALAHLQNVAMMSFEVQLDELYAPLLREVGEAWCEGRATISQEHFATGFVRERLTAMLVALNAGPGTGGHVLCSGFGADPHELPVLILSSHLALAGFRVTSLGVSMPVEALARAVSDSGTRLVCVSLTIPPAPGEVEAYTQRLLAEIPEDCVVALGGAGVPGDFSPSDRVLVPESVDQLIGIGRELGLASLARSAG